MARRIVFTSGKGGVGKTTCTSLIGLNLARLGAKVVLLDADIGLNNLDVVVGIDTKINYDIVDVVEGKCRVSQALIQYDKLSLLYFLPSVHSLNLGKVSEMAIKHIIDELDQSFDYILLDCPAGIGIEFNRVIFNASEAVIVTTPHIISVRDANKVSSILCSNDLISLGVIVNRVSFDMVSRKLMLNSQDIADALGLKLLGQIPESVEITTKSSMCGDIYSLNDNTMRYFFDIAKNIHFVQDYKGTKFLKIRRNK